MTVGVYILSPTIRIGKRLSVDQKLAVDVGGAVERRGRVHRKVAAEVAVAGVQIPYVQVALLGEGGEDVAAARERDVALRVEADGYRSAYAVVEDNVVGLDVDRLHGSAHSQITAKNAAFRYLQIPADAGVPGYA